MNALATTTHLFSTPICFAELDTPVILAIDPFRSSWPSSIERPFQPFTSINLKHQNVQRSSFKLQTKQIQTSTWTACKRKDRLLSEPSTMALLTCQHWTAISQAPLKNCVAIKKSAKCTTLWNRLFSNLPHYPKHLKLNDITLSARLSAKKGPTLGPSPEASPSKPGPSNRTPFTAPERDSTAKCTSPSLKGTEAKHSALLPEVHTVSHMVYA